MRESPSVNSVTGRQFFDYLNMLETARAHGGGASFFPAQQKCVTLVRVALDGMAVKVGEKTDQVNMVNVGHLNHDVTPEEARSVLAMDYEPQQEWLRQRPFITEYVQVQAMLADRSYYGGLGYEFSGKGGGESQSRR